MRRALLALAAVAAFASAPVALAGRSALTGKGLDPYVPILSTYVPTWAIEGSIGFWEMPSRLPAKVPELFSSKFALVVNVAFGLVTPDGGVELSELRTAAATHAWAYVADAATGEVMQSLV